VKQRLEGKDDLEIALEVRKGLTPEIPSNVPDPLKHLMKRCWELLPRNRPTFKDLCQDLHQIIENKSLFSSG
jgi:hypothetical protein